MERLADFCVAFFRCFSSTTQLAFDVHLLCFLSESRSTAKRSLKFCGCFRGPKVLKRSLGMTKELGKKQGKTEIEVRVSDKKSGCRF